MHSDPLQDRGSPKGTSSVSFQLLAAPQVATSISPVHPSDGVSAAQEVWWMDKAVRVAQGQCFGRHCGDGTRHAASGFNPSWELHIYMIESAQF